MTENSNRTVGRNIYILLSFAIGLAIFAMAAFCNPSYAGSMNAAEARVYSEASGTFEYEGKLYRAYQKYLDQLAGYMCSDDVDISEETADEALSRMYASVGVGVAQGYLYQIGVTESDDSGKTDGGQPDDDSKRDDKKHFFDDDEMDKKPAENEDEYKNSDIYKENKDIIEGGKEDAAEDYEQLREERKNNLKKAEENIEKILVLRPDTAKENDASLILTGIPGGVRAAAMLIALLSLVMTVAAGILLALNKCLFFQKKKPRSGHGRRKTVRKVCAAVLIAVVGINGAFAVAGLGYKLSYGSDECLYKTLEETGIYHIRYNQLMENIASALEEFHIDSGLCEEIVTYSDFQFDCEKATKSQLASREVKSTHSGVEEKIVSQMELVAYLEKKDAEKFGKSIIDVYRETTVTPVGSAAAEMRMLIKDNMGLTFIISIVNVILALILLIAGQRKLSGGFARAFAGCLAATVIAAGITAVLALGKMYTNMPIADDELYVLFVCWSHAAVKNLAACTGAAAVFTAIMGISAAGLGTNEEV